MHLNETLGIEKKRKPGERTFRNSGSKGRLRVNTLTPLEIILSCVI